MNKSKSVLEILTLNDSWFRLCYFKNNNSNRNVSFISNANFVTRMQSCDISNNKQQNYFPVLDKLQSQSSASAATSDEVDCH